MGTIPARRDPANIRWSIFKVVKEDFQTPFGYPVDYNDPLYDSDKIQEGGTVNTRWVRLRVLSEGAGAKGDFLLQCDCIGRIGNAATDDRYGRDHAIMCSRLRSALHRQCIPVYENFTAGGGPTVTTGTLIVQAAGRRGHGFRVPQEERGPYVEDGCWRSIFTYRMIHMEDGSGSPYYE